MQFLPIQTVTQDRGNKLNTKSKRKTLKVFIILALLTTISGCRELSEKLDSGNDENLKVVNREKPNLSDESAKITVDPDSDKLTEEKNAPVEKQNSNTATNGNTSTNVNQTTNENSSSETTSVGNCSENPADTEIYVYADANFAGNCVKISKIGYQSPNMDKFGIPNDAISSIKVGSKVRAVVCEHNEYKGKCQSLLENESNLVNSYVGNDNISSIKALDKNQEIVAVNFFNQTDKTVLIYELVGGVNSVLGTLEPNGAGKIWTTVMTTVAAGIKGSTDGKISNGIQIKDASSKAIDITLNDDGLIQMFQTQ